MIDQRGQRSSAWLAESPEEVLVLETPRVVEFSAQPSTANEVADEDHERHQHHDLEHDPILCATLHVRYPPHRFTIARYAQAT